MEVTLREIAEHNTEIAPDCKQLNLQTVVFGKVPIEFARD